LAKAAKEGMKDEEYFTIHTTTLRRKRELCSVWFVVL
jgi:hypothetical protein